MKNKSTIFKNGLKIGLLVLVVIGALVLARITYVQVRDFVARWNMTSLPGVAISDPTPDPSIDEGDSPPESESPQQQEAVPSGPTPEPWDGASRVNVLVMGLDYNDWRGDEGPPRTDTMILLTIDPITMTAGMLSIPRDLWVSIPGFEHGRINTAYQLGEAYQLPNGGPGLASKTVEQLLGVPVQYYAQVDFNAFVYFVDEVLDGVKVDVPYPIMIDIYDDDKGKFKLQPGVQTLPGEYALAYVRVRTTEGADFARSRRQQQVILAIRRRILKFDILPTLIKKGPELYQELSSSINTNLTLDQALQLAWLSQDIPLEEIRSGVIGSDQVLLEKSPEGWDILKPISDEIRILRDEIFAPEEMVGPLAYDDKELVDLMVEENANLVVLNGTTISGLANSTDEYLQSLGANVLRTNNAEASDNVYTQIYDYTGNPYTLKYFADLMGISGFRIHSSYKPDSDVDVTIILGNDWASNNPMP
ncbi:MAG: LCP family protein [Chloroflexota bacterium]|nr:LCP family protein [Chloroflexota bacterium]